eukprot:Gb_21955 [translate_table: standard]
MFNACYFLQLVSELSVEDLGELVYAWKLPRVVGNAWNGLIPAVALQLEAVAHGCEGDFFVTRRETSLSENWCSICRGFGFVYEPQIVADSLKTLGLRSCGMLKKTYKCMGDPGRRMKAAETLMNSH